MNSKLKLKELEAKAKEIFGENFISLSEACVVFNKTLSRKELSIFCSFSKSEDQLKQYAKNGFCLITVPKRMTVEEICSMVPGLFIFSIGGSELFKLKNKIIEPGRYLIKREPTSISFDGLMMREGEMKCMFPKNPELAVVICAYALCHLLGRRKLLVERICIICREEIISRIYGRKMHVRFQKKADTAIKIEMQINQMLIPNFLQIEKV